MLNTKLIKPKAISKCFSGVTSNDFTNYIKTTLKNKENEFEVAISHMAINDLLKRGSNMDVVTNSIMIVVNECKNYGIKNIFVSGLTIINGRHSDMLTL